MDQKSVDDMGGLNMENDDFCSSRYISLIFLWLICKMNK